MTALGCTDTGLKTFEECIYVDKIGTSCTQFAKEPRTIRSKDHLREAPWRRGDKPGKMLIRKTRP
jgi:hypothetical protein